MCIGGIDGEQAGVGERSCIGQWCVYKELGVGVVLESGLVFNFFCFCVVQGFEIDYFGIGEVVI